MPAIHASPLAVAMLRRTAYPTLVDGSLISQARELLERAERIVALTGAGISTESGIPDFRGPQGVWTKNPGAEKLSTLQHYMADQEVRRHAWQARMRHETWDAKPNSGHAALVQLERIGKLDTLITQNIDGLHQRAGSAPERVIEIHGTIHEVVCMSCGERTPMPVALKRVASGEHDPACLACGGILKSATISFGQPLVAEDLVRADRAARGCDLVLAIGTSLTVFPIANVVPVAKRCGARVVILNGEATEMDRLADVALHGAIGEILPCLVPHYARPVRPCDGPGSNTPT